MEYSGGTCVSGSTCVSGRCLMARSPRAAAEASPLVETAHPEAAGRVYFAIAYSVDDRAFERAAETWAAEVKARPSYNSTSDVFLMFSVRTEGDFRAAWDKVHAAGGHGRRRRSDLFPLIEGQFARRVGVQSR